MGKILKVFTVLVSLVLVLSAIGVAMLAFPIFGNQALIVRSGSMEPAIKVGSVVVVRAVGNHIYNVGDVISFKYDANTIITHRVASIENGPDGTFYKTKGDANEEVDSWTVASKSILGKNYITIPEFGKALAFARSKYGFPLLIIFPASLVILIEFINIIREIRNSRKKREGKLLIHPLKFPDEGYKINASSFFNKRSLNILKIFIPIIAFGFFFQNTSAFFSDTETSTGNFFQAASSFPTTTTPTPTPTLSPTPTLTPTPTPGNSNLCGKISLDISGNGVGSVNSIFIICKNNKVIFQSNSTNVNTNIITNTNTGNNTNNGNTNSGSSTTTGDSSTTVNVTVGGSSNTNNSLTPTPTP